MKFNEAFEQVLKEVGATKTQVSVAAGKKNMSALGMLLNRNNPRLDQLQPYLQAAGYNVVLVPSNKTAFLPDDYFVIDECGTGGE